MVINVVLITYNHSQYVEEAFLSIINQKMPNGWDIEIIVADDASPDNTLNILKDLASKATVPVKFLPEQPNLGHPKNYQRAFNACEGEYIAILEGDDYWISDYHLYNHIEFLNYHKECVLSMNRPILYNMENKSMDLGHYDTVEPYFYLTGRDLALKNRLGNLSSCILRNEAVKKLSQKIFCYDMDDWLLGLSIAQYGIICKHKQPTSVWRIHSNGQWSGLSVEEKGKRILRQIKNYDECLNGIYHQEFETNRLSVIKQFLPFKNTLAKRIKLWIPPLFVTIGKQLTPKAIRKYIKM